jgi:hypothetical protein
MPPSSSPTSPALFAIFPRLPVSPGGSHLLFPLEGFFWLYNQPTNYSGVKDTRAIHQLVTTEIPGELKVRKRGCYSCDNCRSGDLLNCTNPDCDAFWSVQMDRGTPHQQQAISATRSRQNRRDLGHFFASTAQPGSLVAVALSGSAEPALVNITKAAFAVDKDHIKCPTTTVGVGLDGESGVRAKPPFFVLN